MGYYALRYTARANVYRSR